MSKTGNVIDYTLRVQKNVERKILSDIIRSLNYFTPVDQYRYIGFGSFYYKDFLLFHEKFNIHNGISIEMENAAFGRKEELIRLNCCYYEGLLIRMQKHIDYWIENEGLEKTKLITEEVKKVASRLSISITDGFLDCIRADSLLSKGFNFSCLGKYDVTDYIQEVVSNREVFLEMAQKKLFDYLDPKIGSGTIKIADEEKVSKLLMYSIDDYFCREKYRDIIMRGITNRYLYNKPYNYIEICFNELINAFDLIEWSEKQNNIIWLDYDSFIDAGQLNGLEKSIKNSNRGDFIIFSTSMGTDDEKRLESLLMLKRETERVPFDVKLKNCNKKGVKEYFQRITADTINDALIKKNRYRANGTPEYKIQPVLECTYSDGTPMYTYGFIIYDETDDVLNINFPGEALKNNIWFPKADGKIYNIYVPALTHKEVNAINQLLPQNDEKLIKEEFPFIETSNIKKYMDMWRYYPNYLEVDSYV